jgi:hypothetical protein
MQPSPLLIWLNFIIQKMGVTLVVYSMKWNSSYLMLVADYVLKITLIRSSFGSCLDTLIFKKPAFQKWTSSKRGGLLFGF